jgi:DNA-binding response OmpR family regulator
VAKILVAEDEIPINELISRNLHLVGHVSDSSFDGLETLEKIQTAQYDLVLLDVMMPGLSGFEVKQKIDKDIPVIFVTAKAELGSRLEGLGLGADDYIVKPFEILELLARVEAVLRRTNKGQSVFEHNGVRVELATRQVFVADKEAVLTPKEFELLETLIINRNLALSRDKLLELVWGFDFDGESRTVDMHVLRLRKKLGWDETIQTVYKLGYRLNTRV